MKVALVHDYLKEYGGAERVLEALHEIWPNAPVFTSVYLPEYLGPHRQRFKDWDIRTSWLQNIPFKAKLISPFRLIAPYVFGQFDFSQFDVVIVSATGAYAPNTIHSKSQVANGVSLGDKQYAISNKPIHICYCHTPPRYLYGFATARDWKKNIFFKILGETANHFLRLIDFNSSQNVDYFVANSKNVAGRIKKFYRRESTVIYPPVDIEEFKVQSSKFKVEKEYFLAGGRLARPKHIDLIIQACQELDIPLKVFGKEFGDCNIKDQIAKIKTTNRNSKIEYLGEVTDEEKWEFMRNAKAYIFAAEDEDFGITPVEAMVAGTPVIAYRSGGVVESVIDGKTGIFFNELSVESLIKAIKQFNNATIKASDCIERAHLFSKERFKTEIMHFVLKVAVKE